MTTSNKQKARLAAKRAISKKIKTYLLSLISYHLSLGFTLLELVIVFSLIAIISVGGIAAFVDYNKTQTLNTSALDVANMLGTARSRALSQVKPDSYCAILLGYKVGLCKLSATDCLPGDSSSDYALYALCDNNNLIAIQSKNLPSGVSFNASTTITTSVLFNVLSGGVTGAGTIKIIGFGKPDKVITINSSGTISSN